MAQLISKRYANALFELALENNKIDEFEQEVRTILESISDKEFLVVLKHPQIASEEKMNIFEKAFKGNVSDEILGLISVVLRKNREPELIDILSCFLESVEKHKGIVTAYVSSAKPLTEEQLNAIKEKLSQNLDKQVVIEAIVDESLIGGVCINVAGHIIDGSIKKKLSTLKKQLSNIQLA